MDIRSGVPSGRQVVESYGAGRFRVAGRLHEGSILILPDRTLAWPVAAVSELTLEGLQPLLDLGAGAVEVLLLGCGETMAPIPGGLREGLREHGIVIEPMDTGAACRTHNVLLTEERRAAAALIAVE